MKREHFGQLIRALRQQHIDVRGTWTQQQLAEKANLSADIIGKIERGEKAVLESEAVLNLAGAFGLTTVERETLLLLSVDVTRRDIVLEEKPQAILQSQLAQLAMMRNPSLIYDGNYQIIAASPSWLKLHNLSPDFVRNELAFPTLVHLVHHPQSPMKQGRGASWARVVQATTGFFRTVSLPYRHTVTFNAIYQDLMQYDSFVQAWYTAQEQSNDHRNSSRDFRYHHQEHGELSYYVASTRTIVSNVTFYLAVLEGLNEHTGELFYQWRKQLGGRPEQFVLFGQERNR